MNQNPTRFAALASSGMIVPGKEPLNLEMPFASLDGFSTANEQFYVRSHRTIPQLAAGSWRLDVEGDVENPFSPDHAALATMDARTITTTMECVGNGRTFLEPQRDGAQ